MIKEIEKSDQRQIGSNTNASQFVVPIYSQKVYE